MAKPDHVLVFVTDKEGQLFVHADAKGLTVLIEALERLRKKAVVGECEHDHLLTDSWAGSELSEKLGCEKEGVLIHHVKLYGWTADLVRKQGFTE